MPETTEKQKEYFEGVLTRIIDLFETIEEKEEEIKKLEARNDLLIKTFNKLLKMKVLNEAKRREWRREAGIISQ